MMTFVILFTGNVKAQSFLNGNFEITTVTWDAINMTNAAFNVSMSDTYAFGSYGDMDIITSATWGPPQSGSWYVALTGGGTDIITMKLSAPLVAGNSYTITFYDRAYSAFATFPVQLGLSTVNNALGTTIYTGPTPSFGVWSLRTATFTAPNNGQYISVTMTAGGTGNWANIDNFNFTAILPVELLYFNVDCSDAGMRTFKWATASETDNSFFTIEASADGNNWTAIGTLDGAGTSTQTIEYSKTINAGVNMHYFRLKQTDIDGNSHYSDIQYNACGIPDDGSVSIYPNPVMQNAVIAFNSPQLNASCLLTDIAGRAVMESFTVTGERMTLDMTPFPKGIYLLKISTNGNTETYKIVKN